MSLPELPWRLCRAMVLGRWANRLSRAAGLGAGTTIGGRVVLALAPDALSTLAGDRVLACVSGTNGKSTTTRMLAAALERQQPVTSNTGGANLPTGLVAALAGDLTASAVLEVDEMFVPLVLGRLRPRVLVLLNLSRDQLDRTADPHSVADRWARAVEAAPDTRVVANCDDPRVVWAARLARDVVWVAAGLASKDDCHVCPRCGCPLTFADPMTAVASGPDAPGQWDCRHCGLARPEPDVRLEGDRLVRSGRPDVQLALRLPGRVNVSNAAMAVTAAELLGASTPAAVTAARGLTDVQGRYGQSVIAGHRCRLLLAKNPAGWAATLDLLDRSQRPLLLSLNAEAVDGRDTSWLYDVPFQRLRGRPVVVTGTARADLSLRLTYAGVAHESRADPVEGVALAAAGRPQDPVDAVADYSGFQTLRRHGARSRVPASSAA